MLYTLFQFIKTQKDVLVEATRSHKLAAIDDVFHIMLYCDRAVVFTMFLGLVGYPSWVIAASVVSSHVTAQLPAFRRCSVFTLSLGIGCPDATSTSSWVEAASALFSSRPLISLGMRIPALTKWLRTAWHEATVTLRVTNESGVFQPSGGSQRHSSFKCPHLLWFIRVARKVIPCLYKKEFYSIRFLSDYHLRWLCVQ